MRRKITTLALVLGAAVRCSRRARVRARVGPRAARDERVHGRSPGPGTLPRDAGCTCATSTDRARRGGHGQQGRGPRREALAPRRSRRREDHGAAGGVGQGRRARLRPLERPVKPATRTAITRTATALVAVNDHNDGGRVRRARAGRREGRREHRERRCRDRRRDVDVVAHTVNGRIDARSTGGPVRATRPTATSACAWPCSTRRHTEYRTTNGSITVELPASANADLDMRTTNGGVSSDFPLMMEGSFSPRRLRATLGSGGAAIRLSTVNGSIRLRKLS